MRGTTELISYAQNFEDIRLWRAFRDVANGRYLDIGTQDPILDSVSFLFYERGWRGVHVEPTSNYAAAMRNARPDEYVIEAAVSSSPVPLSFYEIPDTGLSTGVPEIARRHKEAGWTYREILVPTVTLASLFDYMGEDPIQWLKIDVEGMEADVLASWGTHPARPAVLVIEATEPLLQKPSHEAWRGLVTERGYREVLFDGLSLFFVHESESQRAEALALSPNVFDEFCVLRTHFCASRVTAETDQALANMRSAAEAQARDYAERLAETASKAAEASAELDAALRRAGELEDRLASEAQAHAVALAEANAVAVNVTAMLDSTVERASDLEGRLLSEARLRAEISAKLDLMQVRAAEMERQLKEQAQLHTTALALAEKGRAAVQRALEEANVKLTAAQAENMALSRLAGRLEERLEVQELGYAARIDDSKSRQEELRDRLRDTALELAKIRELADGLREQLFVQIEQSEAAAAASAAERERLSDQLEATRTSAAESQLALIERVEKLSDILALREEKIAEADTLLNGMPHPLASTSGFRRALIRRLIGLDQLAEISAHQRAALAWRQDRLVRKSSPNLANGLTTLDRSQHAGQEAVRDSGAPMSTDSDPITSVEHLLALGDRAFIRSAYEAVLGRAPDDGGEEFYLKQLRGGAHKMAILKQLRGSPEGRSFSHHVEGLDAAITQYNLATVPVLGFIVRTINRSEGNSRFDRRLRALENEIQMIRQLTSSQLSSIESGEARHSAQPAGETTQSREEPRSFILSDEITFQPIFRPNPLNRYNLDELLRLHDIQFVRAAYLAILHREPDDGGLRHYLLHIRAGASKIQILADFVRSAEGKTKGAVISGLKSAIMVEKALSLPLVGGLLSMLVYLSSVRQQMKELRILENRAFRMAEESYRTCREDLGRIEAIIRTGK